MEKFSIKRIVEVYKPDIDELAKALFPTVAYPALAFKRVLKGEANLDSTQIAILASYLGLTVSDLYTVDDTDWSLSSKDSRLIFKKGEYRVIIYGSSMTIYKNEVLVSATNIVIPGISIEKLLEIIEDIIKENIDKK